MLNIELGSEILQHRKRSAYALERETDLKMQYMIVAPIKLVPQDNDRQVKKGKVKEKNSNSGSASKSSSNVHLQDCNIIKIHPKQISRATDTISKAALIKVRSATTTTTAVTTSTIGTTTIATVKPETASTVVTAGTVAVASSTITITASALRTAISTITPMASATAMATATTSSATASSSATATSSSATAATATTIATETSSSATATLSRSVRQTEAVRGKGRSSNKNGQNDCVKCGGCGEWKSPFKTVISTGIRKQNSAKYFAYDLSRDELKHFTEDNVAMKPASASERQLLYDGQRLQYLNQRYEHLPPHKYNYPEATSWRIGWFQR